MNQVVNIKERKRSVEELFSKDYGERIKNVLGNNEKKFAKFKSALISMCLNKELIECDLASILQSAKDLAEIDLDINPLLGQAYIVKYNNKIKDKETNTEIIVCKAQPIISYKGYITLAERFGKQIKAYSIFKCDDFSIDLSDFDEKIIFKPNLQERNESDNAWFNANFIGVLVKVKDNDSLKNQFVSRDKLFKIAGESKSKNSKYSPYEKWGEEMYLAKAIKYVLSKMPMNEKISRAIEIDNIIDTQQVKQAIKEDDLISDLIDSEIQVEPVSDVLIEGYND